MDKSLDDIISARPKSTGRRGTGRRSTGRNEILGKGPTSPTSRARAAAAPKAAAAASAQPADKIIVSNLPQDVNEVQVKELFHSTVGPLRDVTLHYDATGRSKGIAAVHFQRKGDGTKAYQQYNNRLIDGKRPMKIEIVLDPAKPLPAASLVSRVAPPPADAPEQGPRNGVRGRRGRGGKAGSGGGGGRNKNERPQKSAADLDAEMEDYTASNAPAAPVAA